MVALYLTSSAAGTGKTSVAVGLARRLLGQHKTVGFLKPIVTTGKVSSTADAAMMQRFLCLPEGLEVISPTFTDENALSTGIKAALVSVSSGKDVVVIEGPAARGQLALYLALAVDAQIVGVESYADNPATLLSYYKGMGRRLAGIVVNKVPGKRLGQVAAGFAAQAGGLKLLGVVPEARSVAALSVAELALDVGGSIVSGSDGSSVIVENIMLAAMNADHGPEYYAWKEKKAVIMRSERPDMQLAALETPTACLVLTGQKPPIPIVLRRAEANKVPVISTKVDVAAAVAGIEAGFREPRWNDARAAAVAELVDKSLDFGGLFKDLGLPV